MIQIRVTGLMPRLIVGAMVAVISCVLFPLSGSSQSAPPDRSLPRIATAMADLQHYQSSHSLDDLRLAASTLVSAADMSSIKPADLVARRRSIVSVFAQILRQLELLNDRTFNLNDRTTFAQMCVMPPREPSGRQLPPCADPNDMADPATRAAYVAAINENNAKTLHVNLQARVRLLENEVTADLVFDLGAFRGRTAPDSVALDTILRESGTNALRLAKIESAF